MVNSKLELVTSANNVTYEVVEEEDGDGSTTNENMSSDEHADEVEEIDSSIPTGQLLIL